MAVKAEEEQLAAVAPAARHQRGGSRYRACGDRLAVFEHGSPWRDKDPLVAQSRAILAAVAAKEGLVGQWRGMSQRAHAKDADPKLKENLMAQLPKVEEADAKIREAARPKKHHFEVVAAK